MTEISISKLESDVIQLLIEHQQCSIADLESYLNVTANAVRQRLSRLMAAGLVDRSTESEGRGRPSHRYRITEAGSKAVGNNLSDFAGALWHEIQNIPDESIRRSVIAGVVKTMADRYRNSIVGETVEDRIRSVAKFFSDRDIPVSVEDNQGLPTLKILACPYPDLANENHEVCEMELQIFSEVTGGSMELCRCRKDGDTCCSFQAATSRK